MTKYASLKGMNNEWIVANYFMIIFWNVYQINAKSREISFKISGCGSRFNLVDSERSNDIHKKWEKWWLRRYSDWFRAGTLSDRGWVPVGSWLFNSPNRPDWLPGPPIRLSNGYLKFLHRGLRGRGVTLITHLQLVPRPRERGMNPYIHFHTRHTCLNGAVIS